MEIASIIVSALALGIVVFRDFIRDHVFRPKLRVDSSLDEPISRGSYLSYPSNRDDAPAKLGKMFWTRLRVTNDGRSTARRCVAVLGEVRGHDGALDSCYDPLVLRWAISPEPDGLKPFDIAPRRQVDLNLFYTIEGETTAVIVTHKDPIGAAVTFAPGDYWIKLALYSDNLSPIERGYALRWDGTHYRDGIRISRMDKRPEPHTAWPFDTAPR